ncbi:Acg family FMN-binding oxidoreductase [Mycobacterium basiliense]|uniref:Acg family FMN-binding oxidoreductase n=1 Tax=Mycobacterium basiliense TaxID=2094119 RepID=UPI001301241E|nr:NAD(P)H nitroreductase [Mycobacterium basiliense]
MEALKNAVLLASRAPSVHNSQPWRWVAEYGAQITLRLFVDRNRTVPATDRSGRQALLSCGAVLDHFRTAAASAGWYANVVRFPNPNDSAQLATIDFGATEHVTEAERRRADAMLRRRTDRLAFDRPRYWNLVEPILRGIVDEDVAMLDVLTDHQRPQLVEASQLSAALRRDDPTYHAELDWWTSPFALVEGIPPSSLPSDTERHRVDVGREFPVRGHQNRRAEVSADFSKILVLSTRTNTRNDVLRCGEALSRVLLECTMAGMATCTLSHLIESAESREAVRELIGRRGDPQVLIRAGTAPSIDDIPAPTPRRSIDSVFEIRYAPGKVD